MTGHATMMDEMSPRRAQFGSRRSFLVASYAYAGSAILAQIGIWLVTVIQQASHRGEGAGAEAIQAIAVSAALSAVSRLAGLAVFWGAMWLLHRKLRKAPVVLLWFFVLMFLGHIALSIFGYFYYLTRVP